MGSVRRFATLLRGRMRVSIALAASVCLVSGGLIAVTASPAAAAGNTIVSSGAFFPANPLGAWALANNTGTFAFVAGPGTPPGGVGSLALGVAAAANHETVFNYSYGSAGSSTKLTDINALSYSTYRTSGNQAGMATYNIEVDPDPGGPGPHHFTTLVFIPNYPSVVNSTWQTWDAMNSSNGTWYSTTNLSTDFPGSRFACDFQNAGCDASWSQINMQYPNARVVGGLGPNVGSGGIFAGNVDNFTVGTSTPLATTVFDFEPACTTVCYVSNSGSDSSTGVSPSEAFLTVQHGIDTVTTGGTVHVAAGTYNEQVSVNKTISLLGAQAGVDARTRAAGESILAPPSAAPAGRTPLWVSADNATIDGFTVQGNTYVPLVGAGVYLQPGSHGTQFVNNIVKNNVVGLFLANDNATFPTLIQHNLFKDNTNPGSASGNDIYADNSTAGGAIAGATIDANKFTNSGFVEGGFAVDMSNVGAPQFSQITVSNNAIDNHGRGVLFAATANSTVTGNSFVPDALLNHYGVLIWDVGNPALTNTNVSVHHNALGCAASCVGKGAYVLDTAATGIAIFRNNLQGLANGITSSATAAVDGTCNWWGAATGPGAGQVVGNINAATWLASSNLNGACAGGTPPGPPTIVSVYAGPSPDPSPVSVVLQIALGSGGAPTSFTATCVSLSTPPHPTVVVSGPSTQLLVGGLTSPGGYQCTVTATNAFGTSAASAPFTFFIGGTGNCRAIPTAPTAVTTAPGNASAQVSWAPSQTCVAGYIVTPFVGSVALPELAQLIPASELQGPTTTVIKGLTNGVTYKFTVQAENGFVAGPASPFTASITAGAPAATSLSQVARAAKGAVRVKFKAGATNGAPITSFTATCKSSNGGVTKAKKGKASPIVVNGLTANKVYSCTVAATNKRGTGPASRRSSAVKA